MSIESFSTIEPSCGRSEVNDGDVRHRPTTMFESRGFSAPAVTLNEALRMSSMASWRSNSDLRSISPHMSPTSTRDPHIICRRRLADILDEAIQLMDNDTLFQEGSQNVDAAVPDISRGGLEERQ